MQCYLWNEQYNTVMITYDSQQKQNKWKLRTEILVGEVTNVKFNNNCIGLTFFIRETRCTKNKKVYATLSVLKPDTTTWSRFILHQSGYHCLFGLNCCLKVVTAYFSLCEHIDRFNSNWLYFPTFLGQFTCL